MFIVNSASCQVVTRFIPYRATIVVLGQELSRYCREFFAVIVTIKDDVALPNLKLDLLRSQAEMIGDRPPHEQTQLDGVTPRWMLTDIAKVLDNLLQICCQKLQVCGWWVSAPLSSDEA